MIAFKFVCHLVCQKRLSVRQLSPPERKRSRERERDLEDGEEKNTNCRLRAAQEESS